MSYSDLIQRDNPAIVWSLDDFKPLTSAAYISSTSASFTVPITVQIFVVGQVVNIEGVTGGNYNQTVTVTAIGGTSGAYTFTASGTGFTNNAGTGGKYSLGAYPDRFYKKSDNSFITGTYLNVTTTGFPLVYGGKQAIKILSNGYVKVPSLDKMSIKDSRNNSSIEFWVKVDQSSSSNKVIMQKSGTSYETKIYLNNDYLVFRVGKTSKYYEVSTPIDSVNKVLHVVASYSPSSISLIVNGVSKTKTITDPDSLFPAYSSGDEYFNFIGLDFSNIQIDCISLYSYDLPRERALKHFVYGAGYSLPSDLVNSNSGVFYNFSMDGHKEINKYDMGPGSGWSISSANNCLIQDGVLTIKTKQEPKTYYADNFNQKDFSLFADSKYVFANGSYLEIESINSIIPDSSGGWAAEFSGGTYSSNRKILMSIGSKASQSYVEFYTVISSSVNTIAVDINGSTTVLKTGHDLATSFYIGYYRDISSPNSSKVFFLPSTGTRTLTVVDIPQITSAYARFGSDNIWFDGEDISNIEENLGVSNTSLSKIVGIHKDNILQYDTYAKITSATDFIHYYTAIPDSKQLRFTIKSYAKAVIDIDQQMLCPPQSETTGVCRVEVGNPLGSSSLAASVTGVSYLSGVQTGIFKEKETLTDRVITSGTWLNRRLTQTENSVTNPVDTLSFEFVLKTDDLVDRPPFLNYFRVFAYNAIQDGSDYYINNNSSPGGNPARIYLKSGECNIPDLIEMPFFYNGYSSGLKLKTSYAKINHNFTAVQAFTEITAAAKGTSTVYTVTDNSLRVGEFITVSGLSVAAFNFTTAKEITGVDLVNKTITVSHNTSSASDITSQEGYAQIASGISSVMFMCYIPKQTTGSALTVITIKDNIFTINSNTGAIIGGSGSINTFVNGVSSSTAKTDEWQNITITFNSPVIINDTPINVILGNTSGNTTEFYIDQLMMFDKKLITNSGLGSLDNIYNAFTGNQVSRYIVKDDYSVMLSDTNESKSPSSEDIFTCTYYYPESDDSLIYNTLSASTFTSTKTMTITYNASAVKTQTITTNATKASLSTDNFAYVPPIAGVFSGSKLIKIGSTAKNINISALTDKVEKTLTAVEPKKVTTGSAKNVKVTLAVNNISGVQVGDTVTSLVTYTYKDTKTKKNKTAPAIKSGAIVTARSGTSVTVQIPKPGLSKALPNGTVITFNPDPTTNRIVLSADAGTAIAKNTVLTFNNKILDSNKVINDKLKKGQNYLKTGDLILLNAASDVRLYQVTGPVDTTVFSDGQSVSVSFTKVNLIESAIYIINKIKYRYVNGSLFQIQDVETIKRFTYKIAPQYAITE